VFVSFVYLISNGALDWGPQQARRRPLTDRTTDSTVRRIAAGADASHAA
jgi:NADH-quinone oxidoreductase subunit A